MANTSAARVANWTLGLNQCNPFGKTNCCNCVWRIPTPALGSWTIWHPSSSFLSNQCKHGCLRSQFKRFLSLITTPQAFPRELTLLLLTLRDRGY
ncbi:hypothetical protein WJX72_004027 [[Myrmecia] bisecta]|uniref:Uncharacterized protein n=1 Tax=[Myrmecia] bisecta TaxID=41462 RepID=A0AAW1P685_9CHLO